MYLFVTHLLLDVRLFIETVKNNEQNRNEIWNIYVLGLKKVENLLLRIRESEYFMMSVDPDRSQISFNSYFNTLT